MSKKSASVSELESLHGAVAKYFRQRLEESTADMEDEDDFRVPLATGEVANIVSFLKHNNIVAAPDDDTLSALGDEFANDLEAQRIAKAEGMISMTDEEMERQDWFH